MDAKELINQVAEGKDPKDVVQEYVPEPSWSHVTKAAQGLTKKAQELVQYTKKQNLGDLRFAIDQLLAEVHMVLAQGWSFDANEASKALNKARDLIHRLRSE